MAKFKIEKEHKAVIALLSLALILLFFVVLSDPSVFRVLKIGVPLIALGFLLYFGYGKIKKKPVILLPTIVLLLLVWITTNYILYENVAVAGFIIVYLLSLIWLSRE
jgi:4-amino-4-deoxy-L-arabinose transferase-like glycosyltransferase